MIDATVVALAERARCEIEDRRLVGIHGLTLRTTRHHFVHHARTHQTWCAFDSIGIPAALAIDAVAHTDCPTYGRHIDVEMIGVSLPPVAPLHAGCPRRLVCT